jgi:hypothetical protein
MLSAYVCANGAIATGTILVATRYFMESSNRIFVILFLSQGFGLSIRLHHIFTKVLQNLAARVGIEPTTNWLTANCTTAVLPSNNLGDTYGIRTRDLYRDRVAH